MPIDTTSQSPFRAPSLPGILRPDEPGVGGRLTELSSASYADDVAYVVRLSSDATPTPAQLWEEARQSLIRDPLEPAPGERERGPLELSDAEQAVVDELRARDARVRAHEAAHAALGGGSPTYEYETGPDGRRYAVGGQVVIDASGGATAQETIERMRKLRAAALAPGSPSAQDRIVAGEATQREAAARARLNQNPIPTTSRAASAFEDQQARALEEARGRLLGVAS